MDSGKKKLWIVALIVVVGAYFYFSDDDEQAAEAIDNTADVITGNQAVQAGERIKKDLSQFKREQNEKIEKVFDELEH